MLLFRGRSVVRHEEGAVNKGELIRGLEEEYRGWQALLDQIGAARMDEPGVAGPWSIKDIVAHLTGWRRRTVGRLQALQRGEAEPPPPWPPHLQADDEINEWIYQSRQGRPVREVLDESHQVFQELLAAIQGLPDDVLAESHQIFYFTKDPQVVEHFRGRPALCGVIELKAS